ncbi:MAG: 17-hydroxy-3-oxo-4-pregnene-20-carboxyl-CoA lyase [Mycobacterium sp.]|jgi:acetyl-CoA acetyltransferase|nr:17-hydroxy-3-oxo-4-pregnene-20-carboxyl-CoA lyase [Mycobacterium sp.]MDT5251099.1 17-hydroxy-3-oxo-4-pregnene-20-carboxyl-CoA lyase [Mycobacterium sp.]MDT5344643.1 17-hydroxy-3-oxo-4-pregnene-20-carboxyl-CoA lyase [Mycobacterium sp.]MDT7739820.1 17-hydroxy-3-oxo-4-pregnene-20-carboxyl-CoA lyase [Mycobacterium sp.]
MAGASGLPKAAIVGVGQTEFSKNSGRSELQLAAEAVKAAIDDAGLTPADIDGLVTFTQDENDELDVMRSVGIPRTRWVSRTSFGGSGSAATVQQAAAAVISGMADAVVIYRAFNERSGQRFGQPAKAQLAPLNLYLPFGLDTPAKMYSLWFQRYMDTYGLTNADFGLYSVQARKYAATNPRAWFFERPITLDDHQSSRWIVEPILRLLDCCQESDGGVAVVVSTEQRARDLRHPVVRIAAATHGNLRDSGMIFNYFHPDLTRFAEAEAVAEQLYAAAALAPSDIDVAMLYENFSPVVFYQLEAFGFCGRGEARDFIADGNLAIDGAIPVNTHGGLLGEGYIHGVNNIVEAVRQLRGTAANQVEGARNALVASGHSGTILSSD